jgi:hypothetical protein
MTEILLKVALNPKTQNDKQKTQGPFANTRQLSSDYYR